MNHGVLQVMTMARPGLSPFSRRRRLAQDGALLGRLTRLVVETVLAFYAARAAEQGWPGPFPIYGRARRARSWSGWCGVWRGTSAGAACSAWTRTTTILKATLPPRRSRAMAPKAPSETPADGRRPGWPERTPAYRPWAELLARTNGGKVGGPEAFAIAWWRAFRVGSLEG